MITLKPKSIVIALAVAGLVAPVSAFAAYGKTAKKARRASHYGYRSKAAATSCSSSATALDKVLAGNSFAASGCQKGQVHGQLSTGFVNFTNATAANTEGKLMRLQRGAAIVSFDSKISRNVAAKLTMPTVAFDNMGNAGSSVEGVAGSRAEARVQNPQLEAFITYQDKGTNLGVKAGQFYLSHGSYDVTEQFPTIDQMVSQFNTQAVEVAMTQDDINARVGIYSVSDIQKGKDAFGFELGADYTTQIDNVKVNAGVSLLTDSRDIFSTSGSHTHEFMFANAAVADNQTAEAKMLFRINAQAEMDAFKLGLAYSSASDVVATNGKLALISVMGSYHEKGMPSFNVSYETAGDETAGIMNVKSRMGFGVSQNIEGVDLGLSYFSGKHADAAELEFSGFSLTAAVNF